MPSKLLNLIKFSWGKVTALAVGLGAIFVVVDYFLKWGISSYIVNIVRTYISPTLSKEIPVKTCLIIILIIVLLLFLYRLIGRALKKKEYYLPIKSRFYNGAEPSDYSRKTKWYFKQNKNFYYVPLLSHSYNSIEFVDLCGPYCSKCDHILHVDGSKKDLGNKFICVNCAKKYAIPKELLGDYQQKLTSYFKEEYRQKRIGEAR